MWEEGRMSVSCRNLGKTIIKALPLHQRRLGVSIYRRRIQSSSSMEADLKSTFLNVYSVLKSDLLHDPSFEFTDESRLWVERVCTLLPLDLIRSLSDPLTPIS